MLCINYDELSRECLPMKSCMLDSFDDVGDLILGYSIINTLITPKWPLLAVGRWQKGFSNETGEVSIVFVCDQSYDEFI
jgi:hypothetical protein